MTRWLLHEHFRPEMPPTLHAFADGEIVSVCALARRDRSAAVPVTIEVKRCEVCAKEVPPGAEPTRKHILRGSLWKARCDLARRNLRRMEEAFAVAVEPVKAGIAVVNGDNERIDRLSGAVQDARAELRRAERALHDARAKSLASCHRHRFRPAAR